MEAFSAHNDKPAVARPWRDSRFVRRVRTRHAQVMPFGNQQLQAAALRLRQPRLGSRLSHGTLIEAFALMTEAIRRTLDKVYYDVQLLGGLALARGAVAEMQTGEGKTITAALPAFALGLLGRGAHVATTNAYLAQRDFLQLRPAFELLGMTAGLLPQEHDATAARRAYRCDVTFGTGYDFGFDFLRDQLALLRRPEMRLGAEHMLRIAGGRPLDVEQLQPAHGFAIVDEADSVLIDEATMPLILSTPADGRPAVELLQLAADAADSLLAEQHFLLDEAERSIEFTSEGWEAVHRPLQQSGLRGLQRPWSTYVEQALRARLLLRRDVDYVVVDDQVRIVDQHTGRIHPERSWRDGLQQAVELCEGVQVTCEKSSSCRISRQRYFQFYEQLCGMTGTAAGNEQEFREFYRLAVKEIPTHRPCRRQQWPSSFFVGDQQRNQAIADSVAAQHRLGRPLLVGTRTIRHSNRLSELLRQSGVPHALLNGVQDEEEAQIVARAGRHGAVTIATNMAGRGTDIQLDARAEEAGGLHVIGAEHNVSRRVDRQLAGRAARQGQPGSVQFFVSSDDELFVAARSSLPRRIRAAGDESGQCQLDLQEQVSRLQDRLERSHFQRRRAMVRRERWLESVLESLVGRKEAARAS